VSRDSSLHRKFKALFKQDPNARVVQAANGNWKVHRYQFGALSDVGCFTLRECKCGSSSCPVRGKVLAAKPGYRVTINADGKGFQALPAEAPPVSYNMMTFAELLEQQSVFNLKGIPPESLPVARAAAFAEIERLKIWRYEMYTVFAPV